MVEDRRMVWQTQRLTISRILLARLLSSSSTVSRLAMLTSSELLWDVLRLELGERERERRNSGLGQFRVSRGVTWSINNFLEGKPSPRLPPSIPAHWMS